jgi:hypothetical protein
MVGVTPTYEEHIRSKALEEAARVAEIYAAEFQLYEKVWPHSFAENIATAIRALISSPVAPDGEGGR